MNGVRTLLLAWFLIVLSASSQATLRLESVAVDSTTYHITAYPIGNPAPPVSPFIAESPLHQNRQTSVLPENGQFSLPAAKDGLRFPAGSIVDSNGTITLILNHARGERLYGAGNNDRDRSGSLMHPDGTQVFDNGVTRVPFLWSTGGWSALIANDQTGISWHDDDGRLTWKVPGAYLDVYLSVGPDGYALLDEYSRLTGRAPIPPRWTFGFLMSRWGYENSADVQDKWHQFRDRKIPVDAFIYDYDWFQNDWEFNPNTFPVGSLNKMKALGLHFVGIRKPRVNGTNADYARKQGWALDSPQGVDLHFDLAAARYWWWNHQLPLLEQGVDGWWNDEAEQTYDEFFYMSEAQWDGGRAAGPNRVWSIDRSFAPGIARFGAAAWTGDIHSTWETMANQPGTILNWGLAGNPFVGQDLGGFVGHPTSELYARWIEEAVFQPVMRAHGDYNEPRWPWAYGDDVLAATRKAIELRYRLIPYLYTLAEHASANGAPMVRPLFMEFPRDEKTFDLRDEWLLGDRLLAAPVLSEGGAREIYLPDGGWYDFNSGAAVTGGQTLSVKATLDTIPAYVRAGTILPLGPIVSSTSAGGMDSLEIRIYPGADATFTLYEDDGLTYAYEHGQSSTMTFKWDNRKQILSISSRNGLFATMPRDIKMTVVLPTGSSRIVKYAGSGISVKL